MNGNDQIASRVLDAAVDEPPRPVSLEKIRDQVTRRRRHRVIGGAAALAIVAAAVTAVAMMVPGMVIRPVVAAQPGSRVIELAGVEPLTQAEAGAARTTVAQRLQVLGIPGSVAVAGGHLKVNADVAARLLPALTAVGQVQFRPVLSAAPQPAGTLCPAPSPQAFTACDGQHIYRLGPVVVTSAGLVSVRAARTPAGSWVIQLQFNAAGARLLATATGRIVTLQPPANELAICVDGVVWSAPTVMSEFTGGSSRIAGDFTEAHAKLLAATITGRPLPEPLHASSSRQ
jgi:preprotein translocase subunit SecD